MNLFLIGFSAIVIVMFGHRQFNQWTEAESKREATEPDLLAFAPPSNFTSFGRFTFVSALYCLTLLVLYAMLVMLFSNPPLGQDFLVKDAGITPQNAWLVALFIVTGLSPILPVFSNIERSVREVMHTWAVVPGKAHQMATEVASPNTRFVFDPSLLEDDVLPRVAAVSTREDFSEAGGAPTVAGKWARLNYLLFKYAPPQAGGLTAPQFRSPYTIRFRQDFIALQTEIEELARRDPASVRNRPNSPITLATAEKIDQMLHRLYVLMSCRAFGSTRSWEGAVQYFRRAYGITVTATQGAIFPSGPVFDALALVCLSVFVVSAIFAAIVPVPADGTQGVKPLLWAVSALVTHGLGVLIGWKTFAYRRKRIEAAYLGPNRLSREYLVAAVVLGYACALVPIWLASIYHYWPRAVDGLPQLAGTAFTHCWPWALFGSATAAATYFHLARTANSIVSPGMLALSGAVQGLSYAVLSLLILATHQAGSNASVIEKLSQPTIQLVLLLTTLIGGLLGVLLPSVLHGQGDDRRGGVIRHKVNGQPRRVVLTVAGRQTEGKLLQVSLTGCVARFPAAAGPRAPGGFGNLTLDDGTSVPSIVAREVHRDAEVTDLALRFSVERRFQHLPRPLRGRLQAYLAQPDLQPAG